MMGTEQQSTGNSHLLPWEAGKNVWIVVDSDSDETMRLQRNEAMAVVNNKYMCTFFLWVYVKGYKYFFKYLTYDRWGRKSNLSPWTFIIILIRLLRFSVFTIYDLSSSVCRVVTVSDFLRIGLLNGSDEISIHCSLNMFTMTLVK